MRIDKKGDFMRAIYFGSIFAFSVLSFAAAAQEPVTVEMAQAAPPAIAEQVTTNAVLRAGTPIRLRLLEEITTNDRQASVGQRIRMEVANSVELDGVVVIPAGSLAEGEVTSVRNKGMWGKSGHLEARALYVRVNGRQIRLSGTFDDKGVTGTAGVVGAIALVPLAGFFITGTSAVLPAGGEVPAFIDEDVVLNIRAAAPAPLEVVAPSSPLIVEVPAPSEVTEVETAE